MKTKMRVMPQPVPGEVWEFPCRASQLVGWVVAKHHPDDAQQLFVVPADSEAHVGQVDLAVPLVRAGEAAERVVLRGAFGRWVAAEDFWFRVPGAQVTRDWRREFLGRLVGALDGAAPVVQAEVGAPEDWAEEQLGPATGALEAWAARERPEVSLVARADAPGGEALEPRRLAAESRGALDALESLVAESGAAFAECSVERELYGLFDAGGPRAFLSQSDAGATLEVSGPRPGEVGPPVVFVLTDGGGRLLLEFMPLLTGGWISQQFAIPGPGLRLLLEGQPVLDVELDLEPGIEPG